MTIAGLRKVLVLACAALLLSTPLGACDEIFPSDPAPADPLEAALDSLRDATAVFQDFEEAVAAGYVELTSCWFHGNLGAMGYHYADVDQIDGTFELLAPEALLYEPQSDGSYEFVAVEYIVPIAAWQGTDPPSLLDREFFRDEALDLFTLHIWHLRENPEGVFAPWNPDVTCDHAQESEDRGAGH